MLVLPNELTLLLSAGFPRTIIPPRLPIYYMAVLLLGDLEPELEQHVQSKLTQVTYLMRFGSTRMPNAPRQMGRIRPVIYIITTSVPRFGLLGISPGMADPMMTHVIHEEILLIVSAPMHDDQLQVLGLPRHTPTCGKKHGTCGADGDDTGAAATL